MSMDKSYSEWREQEIKRVGLPTQLKAEAIADRHTNEPLVPVWDTQTGEKKLHKTGVADVYKRRRLVESASRKSFLVPDFPWKNKENES